MLRDLRSPGKLSLPAVSGGNLNADCGFLCGDLSGEYGVPGVDAVVGFAGNEKELIGLVSDSTIIGVGGAAPREDSRAV